MQQQLIDLAVAAGAELLRPAEVTGVIPGDPSTITLRADGAEQRVTAHLVVGADGRNSRARGWAGFPVGRDPDGIAIAGILYRDLALPEDAVQFALNPDVQRLSIIFPIGDRRFRAYVAFRHGAQAPLSGAKDHDKFVELSVATGAPAEWFGGAAAIGPLASFNAPDSWAEHPYREGAVLIGDAAAASDPCFGCGLSLTLRDVRVLRDRINEKPDYAEAANVYTAEHDLYYRRLYRIHGWFRELWFGAGAAADALRARALPRIAEDPTRIADFIAFGPEAPSNETADVRRGLVIARWTPDHSPTWNDRTGRQLLQEDTPHPLTLKEYAMADLDKEKVIGLLNRILEQELAGVVRYTHYSFLVFGHNRIPIVSWLREQAAESLTHAQQAGEMITLLGAYPSLEIGPLLDSHKHDIGAILRESLETEGKALALYRELLGCAEGRSVALEEYARQMVYAEELHASEVDKMLRTPGEVAAFQRHHQAA